MGLFREGGENGGERNRAFRSERISFAERPGGHALDPALFQQVVAHPFLRPAEGTGTETASVPYSAALPLQRAKN